MTNSNNQWFHHMTRRDALRVAGMAVAGGTVLGLAGCGSGSSSAGTSTSTVAGSPKRGGTAQVAVGDAATSENLDPQRPWNQNNGIYVPLAWETLVNLDQNYHTSPSLAASWSSDSATKVWTFHIRPDVKFHDGSPLTGQDVVWSIQRLFSPALASPLAGPLAAVLKKENITAPDPHTVVAKLSTPDSFFPILLSHIGAMIIKNGTNKFTMANAVGTGPFKFTSFQAGQGWTVVKNPTYWQEGLPYLDSVRGVSIPDPTALVEAVTSGSSDLSTTIAFTQIPIVSSTAGAQTLTNKDALEAYIVMDTTQDPFTDVRVRQAFKIAQNRRQIQTTAYSGHGSLTSDTPAPSTDPYYPAQLGIVDQQTDKAKQLLSQAGLPNGVDVEMYTSDLIGGMVDMATAYAQTVAPAGIRVTLKQHPAATYFEQIWLQKPFYTSWVYRVHPAVRVPETFCSYSLWNEMKLKNTQVDSLLAHAQAATNPADQKERLGTLLTWIAENDGYANPSFVDETLAAKDSLQGVEFPQGRGPSLVRAWIS